MNSKKETRAKYVQIRLDRILEPEGRLRLDIDEDAVEELAKSIDSIGMRQAIEVVVREDKFEIVYGERRVLAHRALGRDKIWAKVVELTKGEIALVRATENIARRDLSPVEEAAAFGDMRDRFGMTAREVAEKVGRSAGNVKRRLDLLRMSKGIQKAVHKGEIKVSVAEEIWRCPDEAHREYLLELAVEHGAKQMVVRQWVQDFVKSERSREGGTDGGGEEVSPMESKTIYGACDICDSAVSLSEMVHLGICKACNKKLRSALDA